MLETLTRPLNVIPVVYPVKRKKRFLHSTVYHLTPSAAHLISLITGVKKRYMYNLCVHNNLVPLPKGFDAITWGRKSEKAHISLKKTFFHDDDITMQDITMWINILCHEVSHVPQINKYRFLCFGLLPYLFAHIYYYAKHLSHDKSPLERKPFASQREITAFNNYINKTVHPYALAAVLSDASVTEADKIKQLDAWFTAYKQQKNR